MTPEKRRNSKNQHTKSIYFKVITILACFQLVSKPTNSSDGTAEAEVEALTRDLFGWKRKQKRKQLNQTASVSRYYIDHNVLLECYLYFQPVTKNRKYEPNWTYG